MTPIKPYQLKSKIVLLVNFLLFTLLSFSTQAKEINKTFEIESGGNLVLETDGGSIKIDTHNKKEIQLSVKIKGKYQDEFNLDYKVENNTLNIIGKLERRNWSNTRTKFQLIVPKQFNLDLDTAGGSITISDLVGQVDARTSGGSIRVGNIEGDVKIKTSGGSITTEEIYGNIDAHTSGGSIRVKLTKQLKNDAELTTSGGSIVAVLPEDIKIDLYAATSGGRVSTDFDVDGKIKKRSIRGKVNGGGPEFRLETSGGSVSVKSK